MYVVGGRNLEEARWESRTITLRNDGEEFDPQSNQWTLLAEQLSISGTGRASVVPLDGKLFVIVKVAEFPKLALKHGILLNLPI